MVYNYTAQRIWEVDFARGVAVVTMIIFNYAWALNFFNVVPINISSLFWKSLAFGTAGSFVFIVGISLTLSYAKLSTKQDYINKYIFRGLKIFGYGLIVSVVSYILLKNSFVRFGILHFIGIGIILSIPFINLKTPNLILGASVIGIGAILSKIVVKTHLFLWMGLKYAGFQTVDYFPIFPWFGIILIGMFFGNKWINSKPKKIAQPPPPSKPLCFLGRHSLTIYFLHMMIILSALYLLGYIQKMPI